MSGSTIGRRLDGKLGEGSGVEKAEMMCHIARLLASFRQLGV